MGAFGPDPFSSPTRKQSKYDDYDVYSLEAVTQPNNAPAAPQPASQGALSGGGATAPAPVKGALGEGEARRPEGGGSDFYSMFKAGSDDDREEMTRNVLEPLEAKGVSAEGAAKMLWEQNPQLAAEVGAKFGIVPPADKAGMPGFKTQEQALLDYEADQKKAAEEKARLKKEKRHAMGGFLFEMGLRILASNRPDAGGAIAEGALGTLDARKQRERDAKAEKLFDEDREYQLGEREEAATDRTRRREAEDVAEERAKAEEIRRQEAHDAKMKAGATALGGRQPTAFEVQWGFYKEAFGDSDMSKEDEKALRQKFLSYYNRESKMTVKEKEAMITNFIKLNDDNPDDEWYDLNAKQKRQAAIDSMGLEDKEDADDDPLGLRQ